MTGVKKAIFLDRDGTLIKEVEYLSDPQFLELLPNVEKGLVFFKSKGFLNIIITNQSAIGRGFLTHEGLEQIHLKLKSILIRKGAEIDAIYYCPHKPDDGCTCRKPSHKMLLQAAQDYNIDLAKSFMIGDRLMDVVMGKNVGLKTAIITSKWTELDGNVKNFGADFIGKDLYEVASWIQKQDMVDE